MSILTSLKKSPTQLDVVVMYISNETRKKDTKPKFDDFLRRKEDNEKALDRSIATVLMVRMKSSKYTRSILYKRARFPKFPNSYRQTKLASAVCTGFGILMALGLHTTVRLNTIRAATEEDL